MNIIWDAHACFPLNATGDLSQLTRYKNSGVNFVSINIGMDMDTPEKVVHILAGFRQFIQTHPEAYLLARTVSDIRLAQQTNRLAVAFDLEGSEPLNGNLNLIALYFDLGVRQMLLAYNKDNRASGGCMEGRLGLTPFGRKVIREMNRVGMVVDLSHMSQRATQEACDLSTAPVIYSHSNPKGKRDHARNITDEQIKACAQTGGVIGINGVGDFLGDIHSATVVDHIEYVVNLVGPEHVGLGLDYVVDKQELMDYITAHPDRFPPEKFSDFLSFVAPEQWPEIADLLVRRGYSEEAVRGILGGNFWRVAEQTWR